MSEKSAPKYESAIYRGWVRHRRYTPHHHEFTYPMFMLLLKLDELPAVLGRFWQLGSGRLRWARFRRGDYLGSDQSDLAQAVRDKIAELRQMAPGSVSGEVFLLGHLRYLGFYFSPLNLYFLRQDGEIRFMLAEVSNTPWNERHYYLVDLADSRPHDKAFHVSPFNPMEQSYQWRVVAPGTDQPNCLVHIQSESTLQPGKVFDATLNLQRVALNQRELTRVLLKTPAQTLSMVLGIYWQALKLFVKRTPLYGHPDKNKIGTGKTTA